MSGDGLAGVVFWGVVAIGGYYWATSENPKGDYVTIYQRVCFPKKGVETDDTYYACKKAGGSTSLQTGTFRVDYDRQRLFSLNVWTTRYDKCEIADRLNWNCRSNDGSFSLWMSDGKYFSNAKLATEQISWWQYWLDQR